MTTTPNDAAVNAESAAKLVSVRRVVISCAANLLEIEGYKGNVVKELRTALESSDLIERHATTQTQATHGEGEAVAHDYRECDREECEECQRLVDEGFVMACDRCGMPGSTESDGWVRRQDGIVCKSCAKAAPVPSPTAASALGELAKRLLAHADYLDRETRLQRSENLPPHKLATINQDSDMDGYSYAEQKMREAMHDMRTAAAALTGVAAQGAK